MVKNAPKRLGRPKSKPPKRYQLRHNPDQMKAWRRAAISAAARLVDPPPHAADVDVWICNVLDAAAMAELKAARRG